MNLKRIVEMNKLSVESLDILNKNIEKLKEL